MRVVGKNRMGKSGMGKVEGPRVVGIGLMSLGAIALVLSVAGAAGAGSTAGGVANPAHSTCPVVYKTDGAIAQVLQAQANHTCNQSTTTTWEDPVTTTTHKPCDCGTTTTWQEPVTTTTHKQCGCSTTTTVPETTTSTTEVAGTTITVGSTTTSTSGVTTTVAGTVPDDTSGPTNNVSPPTVHKTITVEGNTVVGPQAITAEPAATQLPFTGSNSIPLAAAGVVMVGTGFGLSRRKRHLTR